MASEDPGPLLSPGGEQQQKDSPPQFKEWPNAVTPAPQQLPGQSTKKSPTK
jgi:hypothetical protein